MKLRIACVIATALFATSCIGPNNSTVVDNKAWLNAQAGPKIEGVQATMMQSAHDADISGDWRTAAGYYQQLADKNPNNTDIQLALADDSRKLGDSSKAMYIYDAVLKKDPSSTPALEGKGLTLLEHGDFDSATNLLLPLSQNGRGTWRTYNALGIIAAARQSPASALQYFGQAQRLSPNNPSVLNNIGLAEALSRDFAGAEKTLSEASVSAATRPNFREQIDLNTAMVYAAAGKLENAEAIVRQYFSGPELDNNMAFYAHIAHDDQLAKTYLNMALTQSKRFYPRAWQNLQALNAQPLANTTDVPAQNPLPPAAPANVQLQPAPVQKPLPPQATIAPATETTPPPAQPAAPVTGYLTPPTSAVNTAAQESKLPTAPSRSPMMIPVQTAQPAAMNKLAPAAGTPQPANAQATSAAPPTQKTSEGSVGRWIGSLLDY